MKNMGGTSSTGEDTFKIKGIYNGQIEDATDF